MTSEWFLKNRPFSLKRETFIVACVIYENGKPMRLKEAPRFWFSPKTISTCRVHLKSPLNIQTGFWFLFHIDSTFGSKEIFPSLCLEDFSICFSTLYLTFISHRFFFYFRKVSMLAQLFSHSTRRMASVEDIGGSKKCAIPFWVFVFFLLISVLTLARREFHSSSCETDAGLIRSCSRLEKC